MARKYGANEEKLFATAKIKPLQIVLPEQHFFEAF